MRFTSTIAACIAAFACLAAADSITFQNKDNVKRNICWIPNPPHEEIGVVEVWGHQRVPHDMPWGWSGMLYTAVDGQDPAQVVRDGTVLGEFTFHGFEDKTWYDVSAIANEGYNDGVHRIYPGDMGGVNSGCTWFPCDGAYRKSGGDPNYGTPSINMVVEIGKATAELRVELPIHFIKSI